MTLISATIILILVMDPLGNIPVFLSILNSVEPNKRAKVILREGAFAFIILGIFLFFGKYIIHGLQISEPALNIAGGIILFLIAIKMIFPGSGLISEERQITEPFIVPLAIPLIAGPSSLAMVLLFATQEPHKMFLWLFAVFLAASVTTIILLFSNILRKLLGQKGLIAVERLMGMILVTMSVQMLLNGIDHYFNLLPATQ